MGVFANVPVVGQGTWNIEVGDRKQAIRALQRGIELGMTHIDTAEMYGGGRAEEIVAEAIHGRRDDVFLVSKVLPRNASYARTLKACEGSLSRLRTDRLDVYLLHWRESEPLEETIRAFEELRAQGKIRAWGVSNFDIRDLEQAEKIAGKGKLACNQVLYHPWERAIEHRIIPWCEEHGVDVVGYSPFAERAEFSPDPKQEKALAAIAKAHATTQRTVSLRFLIQHGTWTIPKASQVAHVEENARALHLELDDEEMRQLEEAFPKGRARGLPML